MKIAAAPTRIVNLDAARGLAMVLVCLSHFAQVYRAQSGTSDYHTDWLNTIGMVASPTFVTISGCILGLLFVIKRSGFESLRTKLVERSLFLLTVAHVLIALSRLAFQSHPLDALRMTFMTDCIALCVLAGSYLITKTSRLMRLVGAIGVFGFAWVLLYAWTPDTALGEIVKEIFVGAETPQILAYTVPLLQWFAVYLVATVFGQYLGDLYQRSAFDRIERALFVAVVASVSAAVGLRVAGWMLVSRLNLVQSKAAVVDAFFSPWSKMTPGIVYILFFGGVGLGLVWLMTVAERRHLARWLLEQASTIGRCSLAVFIFQFYIFYTFLPEAHLSATPLWPVIALVCLAIVLVFAKMWERFDLNRFLTLDGVRIAAVRAMSVPSDTSTAPVKP